MQQSNQLKQTPQTQTVTQQTTKNKTNTQSNLLDKYKNGQNNTTKTTTTTTTTTKVDKKDDKKQTEPVRTYIPSPVGVQVQSNEDLSAADAALRRAEGAEKLALQTLKMN